MAQTLDDLFRDGSVPQDIYLVIREAIQKAGSESGRLYAAGHEAHYQALAAAIALKAAGYSIQKSKTDA